MQHLHHETSIEYFESNLSTMRKIAIALPLLLVLLLLTPVAYAAQPTTVTLSGVVTGPAGTFTIRAEASGSTSSLSGDGTDSPPPGASGNPGVCHFTLTGSISGTVVTLSGAFDQSSIPSLIGLPIVITADASTGSLIFSVAGGAIIETGTGTVTIR